MVRSKGKSTQHSAVIWIWMFCFTFVHGVSVNTDSHVDCKGVQCPIIECPSDSTLQLIGPIVKQSLGAVNGTGSDFSSTPDANSRVKRNVTVDFVSTTESLVFAELNASSTAFVEENGTKTTFPVQAESTTSPHIVEFVTFAPVNLTEQCCQRAECICKSFCPVQTCLNTTLVLIETKPRSNTPGQCCAQYACDLEPDCASVINTNGSWLIDCQTCECVAGQKICHRTCGELRPPPANCLSQNLKRSFLNGETWKEDECTICECANGEKKCLTSFCKALNCERKVKLTGECCPICIDKEVIPENTTTSTSTTSEASNVTTRPAVVIVDPITQPPMPPCNDPRERIVVHVSEPNNEKCILYGLVACLAIVAAIFIGLYFHARSRQRSYRPVPIFDSNFNKIKPIISS